MVIAFVLVSGSIKDLAAEYGVSYPTMRGRLDGVIERLRALVEGRGPADAMSEYLARLIESGALPPSIARQIRDLHRAAVAEADDGRGGQGGQGGQGDSLDDR